MIAIKDNYQLLIEKLDEFIRKYYVNHIIRGALYSIGLILGLFIIFNVLEYNFYFSTAVRKFLFFSFILASGAALTSWVLIPLLHYFRLGKVITHEQAAVIVGNHFGDVKDKLLNVLQLKQQSTNAAQANLILASINQKSEEIKFVPFKSAINLAQNKKYLRYALPPFLLLLLIAFVAPSILKEGTKRLVNNGTEFERPAPFKFVINKDSLTVVQFADYTLKVKTEGNVVPNDIFIDIDNYQYRLNKETDGTFSYKFSNVQQETAFKLLSGTVKSEEYALNVLKKPNILGFDIKLDYPNYTERPDENLSNIGDIVVPVGTNISWLFNAQNTEEIKIKFAGKKDAILANRSGESSFDYRKLAVTDEAYKVFISNSNLKNADSVNYSITVVPDLYPSINVEQFIDSSNVKVIYFGGDASDDYGLRTLSFNYKVKKADGTQAQLMTIPMEKPQGKAMQYKYTFDTNILNLKAGEEVTYYFEVFDNDAVNGNKSSRTNPMVFSIPSIEQYEQMASKNNEEIKDNLEKAIKESKKIQEEMKKIREKLLQQKEMNWQDKKQLENLMNRQKELEKMIEDAKKNFQENLKNQQEFSEQKEEILDKQEKIEKLFDQLQNDEMKKLMEQIQQMMQQLEKDNALEMTEKMQNNNEELNMELDRMLELFKKLEVETEMQNQIEKLEKMAENLDKLSEETEKSSKSQEELQKEQEELNKQFDKLQEKQEELEKKNSELERPKDLDGAKEEMKDTDKDMQDSEEQLEQKQNAKASKKQKSAAQKMRKTAKKMKDQKQASDQEQFEEDMAAMRQLLENIVGLSFNQEDLMKGFGSINVNTPKYVESIQQQFKIKDNFQLVEDSLTALSKRVYTIESFVTEKVAEVKQNMRKGLEELEERQTVQAQDHQQRTMKALNDLALMLNEAMENMQQEMGESMPGDQMCNKPGGKKSGKSGKNGKSGSGGEPKDKMSEGQKKLTEEMKKMSEQMKQGKGQTGQGGQGGQAKQFAEMAAKQAAMRKALESLQKDKQSRGQGDKQLQQAIDDMERIERDLAYKRLDEQTLKRLQDIETRLLESERAEREREYDEKRKGDMAKTIEPKTPPSLQEYLKKREAEIELYRTVSPSLKPYYKNLVEEYFKVLKKS